MEDASVSSYHVGILRCTFTNNWFTGTNRPDGYPWLRLFRQNIYAHSKSAAILLLITTRAVEHTVHLGPD